MVKADLHGQMEDSTLESLTMTRKKAKASLRGTMGGNMMANGSTVNSMVKAFIRHLRAKLRQAYGQMAKEPVG